MFVRALLTGIALVVSAVGLTASTISGRVTGQGVSASGIPVYLGKLQRVLARVSLRHFDGTIGSNPDGYAWTIYHPMDRAIASVLARIKLYHQERSELRIWIEHPDGSVAHVYYGHESGAGTLSVLEWVTQFGGKNMKGDWKLHILDLEPNVNFGTLTSCDLDVSYDGYITTTWRETDSQGNFSFTNIPAGNYRIHTSQDRQLVHPRWRLVTCPPNAVNQDFVAAPKVYLNTLTIVPDTIYGLTATSARLSLTSPAPFDMNVLVTKSSPLIYTPSNLIFTAGVSSMDFLVWGGNVTSDLNAWVYASFSNVTRSAAITVRVKPVIWGMTLSPTEIKGGASSVGTVLITKPAFTGANDMAIKLSDNSVYVLTPPTAEFAHGSTTTTFPLLTVPVTATMNVTISGYFYNSTRTATLTLTP